MGNNINYDQGQPHALVGNKYLINFYSTSNAIRYARRRCDLVRVNLLKPTKLTLSEGEIQTKLRSWSQDINRKMYENICRIEEPFVIETDAK